MVVTKSVALATLAAVSAGTSTAMEAPPANQPFDTTFTAGVTSSWTTCSSWQHGFCPLPCSDVVVAGTATLPAGDLGETRRVVLDGDGQLTISDVSDDPFDPIFEILFLPYGC